MLLNISIQEITKSTKHHDILRPNLIENINISKLKENDISSPHTCINLVSF